ncbi:MAG: type III-B CRISPR module-associated protein Cmr5 [Dissulfuribacterales bacterium]
MRTLGQKRAEYCLEMLSNLNCERSEFKALTAGLPAMILQNGFGQTLAFLLNKASEIKEVKEQGKTIKKLKFKEKDKHYEAFRIITLWLQKKDILITDKSEKDYLMTISKMEQKNYLHAQKETLAMLEWLKRYANAALFEGEGR